MAFSQPNWHYATMLYWRCTVCPIWPLLASSLGSNKSPVSSGPCSVLQLCELNLHQTGAAECASVHQNSWGRSSALTGDDINWQVFIWLISCSLASSRAPDTCFTYKTLTQDEGWAAAAGAKSSKIASVCQGHAQRRWGNAVSSHYWQLWCLASLHQ